MGDSITLLLYIYAPGKQFSVRIRLEKHQWRHYAPITSIKRANERTTCSARIETSGLFALFHSESGSIEMALIYLDLLVCQRSAGILPRYQPSSIIDEPRCSEPVFLQESLRFPCLTKPVLYAYYCQVN